MSLNLNYITLSRLNALNMWAMCTIAPKFNSIQNLANYFIEFSGLLLSTYINYFMKYDKYRFQIICKIL